MSPPYPLTFRQWDQLSDEDCSALWADWLENGLPEPPPRLTRRKRIVAVAADAYEDLGAVLFAVRGVSGLATLSTVVELTRTVDGRWIGVRPLRGSYGRGGGLASDRPATREAGRFVSGYSEGRRLGGGTFVRRRRSVGYATFQCTTEVHRVVVRQRRRQKEVVLPAHGSVIVVWQDDDRPQIDAYDEAGRLLTGDLCGGVSPLRSPRRRFGVRRRAGWRGRAVLTASRDPKSGG